MKKAEEIKNQVKQYESLILRQIAPFIHRHRKDKGITIKDLNIMTGVGTAVISDLENEVSMPRIETLLRICEALEISCSSLFEQMKPIVTNKTNGSKMIIDDTNKYDRLSAFMAGLNYPKEEIVEIVSYIKYLDYKKQIK